MKWKDSLRVWRRDRNLIKPSGAFVSMVQDELEEYTEASLHNDVHGMVDAIADVVVLATNEMELMGYDLDMVMKQVLKEISCRKQLPSQLDEWHVSGPSGKWLKDPNQSPDTLYKADFSTCKYRTIG